MIAKIIASLSAANTAGYVTREGKAFLDSNMGGHTAQELARELLMVWRQNPVKHQAIHLVISFPPGEILDDSKGAECVRRVLAGLGYGDCPFYATKEIEQNGKLHYHVATSPVTYDGVRVERGGDRFAAKRICRELEIEFGLQRVSSSKKKDEIAPEPQGLEAQALNLKDALYAAILPAIRRAKTIADLARDLVRHGVQMEGTISAGGRITALGFRLSGEPGGYLKASEVHESFSIAKLEKKHGLSYEPSRDNPWVSPIAKKPVQPVQPLLAALQEPPPPSRRVAQSAQIVARQIIQSYRTRSSYAAANTTPPDAASRRSTTAVRGPERSAIVAALISAGRPSGADVALGISTGPVLPVVGGREAPATTRRPDAPEAVGTGVPVAASGLATSQSPPRGTSGSEGVAPRDDRGADVALPDTDPRGGSPVPGSIHEGNPDLPGAAAPGPRVSSTIGDSQGRGPGRSVRPPRSGAPAERQPNAPRGPDRAPEPAPVADARTGFPGLGGQRGSRGRDRRGLAELLEEARAICQRLSPAYVPTAPRVPDPAAVTTRLLSPRYIAPEHPITTQRSEPDSTSPRRVR